MGRSKALNDITVQMVRDLFDEQQQDDDEVHMLRFLSTEEGLDDGNNPTVYAVTSDAVTTALYQS